VPRLIVNADDFGLTQGINRAILELNSAGLLTSSTLMANESATDAAIEGALATPTLHVGCHIVLVDGNPILSGIRDIPHLTDSAKGHFPYSLPAFLANIYAGSTLQEVADQIERESLAQIQSLHQRGLRMTHIDTHKHTHMFPRVLRPVLRAARAAGIHAVRNPFEPQWALRVSTGATVARIAQVALLRWLEPMWRGILAEEGFKTTDGTIAVAGTGILDKTTLRSLLSNLPSGTWELVTHPGYNDADLARVRTRLRSSRDVERVALEALREFPQIELISFGDI